MSSYCFRVKLVLAKRPQADESVHTGLFKPLATGPIWAFPFGSASGPALSLSKDCRRDSRKIATTQPLQDLTKDLTL